MLSFTKGPFLQMPTPTTMTVRCDTNISTIASIKLYAAERIHSGHQGNFEPPSKLISEQRSSSVSCQHQFLLTHLQPDTYYFYSVCAQAGEAEIQSGPHPIRAAAPTDTPFSFTVTSETGGFSFADSTEGEINKRIFNQMARFRPDFALFIGDIVNDGLQEDDWLRYFFTPGQQLLATTPFYTCLGNHEDNSPIYYNTFSFPEPKNYYSFDYGDAHFICLDSTAFIPSETYPHRAEPIAPGHPQVDFLIQDLATTSAKWKIVFFHYPPYVSGGYQVEDLRSLSPIFEQYGVDIVLNSHTITYERSYPLAGNAVDFAKGVVYMVAGGAGAMPSWLLPKREWHTAQSLAVPHFVQFCLTNQSLAAYAFDEYGSLFDQLLIFKDQQGNKRFG